MKKTTARELIDKLDLSPHPEGGYYREIYRSDLHINNRSALTSIYFLLEKGQISRWHQVDADEVWHYYAGDPLKLHIMDREYTTLKTTTLSRLDQGHEITQTVKAHEWQAAETTGDYTLVGCNVAPGFSFEGFRFLPNATKKCTEIFQKHPESFRFI